jgi:hypothetical protein
MDPDTQAAIVVNDLDSLRYRIEALPPHPAYTDALNSVTEAKAAIADGRADLHQRNMRERFAKADAEK